MHLFFLSVLLSKLKKKLDEKHFMESQNYGRVQLGCQKHFWNSIISKLDSMQSSYFWY